MASRTNHQDVVKHLLETKAIDFDAVGKAVAKLGPELALADDPWEVFCGTMRLFTRVFIIGPRGGGRAWKSSSICKALRTRCGSGFEPS